MVWKRGQSGQWSLTEQTVDIRGVKGSVIIDYVRYIHIQKVLYKLHKNLSKSIAIN